MLEGKKYFMILKYCPYNMMHHNVERLRTLFIEKVAELFPIECRPDVSVTFSAKNRNAKCKFSITLGARLSDKTMPLVIDKISDAAIASLYAEIYEKKIEESCKEAVALASVYLPRKIMKVC